MIYLGDMTDLPLKVSTHVSALNEAREISESRPNEIIYLFKVSESYGYIIDNQATQYSNEKLIVKLKAGQRL